MPIDEMNGAVTQKMPQLDFSKGSMVLSYDFMVLTDGNFYFAIRSSERVQQIQMRVIMICFTV